MNSPAATVMVMPKSASAFGQSANTAQPNSAATGISRYCIGANVAEGA
jgi:hypothetical protein